MNQSSEEAAVCSEYLQGHVAQVESFVLSTIILLGLLTLLGALRRRVSSGILSAGLLLSYTGVSQGIPYLMGLMKSSPVTHPLFPLWGSMLLFAYGSADNMSAHTLHEFHTPVTFLGGFLLQFAWLSLILFSRIANPSALLLPLLFLMPLMFLKVAERGMALSFACAKSGPASVTMRLAHYMKTRHLGRSGYLIDVAHVTVEDHTITGKITLEQIWECQGPLLSSSGHLKDTCLSIALFWLLLRKFAGYPLHESELGSNWEFARSRLLPSNPEAEDQDYLKAFRVIEMELNFLYDYFYTKYFFYYYNNYLVKVLHIILVFSFASLTLYSLRDYHHGFEADELVTCIMVAALVLLQIVQLCYLLTSRWFQVTLVRYYVKEKVWQQQQHKTKITYYIGKAIEIICTTFPSSASLVRPWQQKLDQHCLLRSYKRVRNDFVSRILYLNLSIPIATMSRKTYSADLTPAVIKAVFQTLKKNGPRPLTNGITSLRENKALALYWAACEFETTIDLILAWHVATTLCEFYSKGESTSQSAATKTNAEVAAKLSKYCAYLVSKAPNLLPDHEYNSKYIYSHVVLDAKRLLGECKSLKDVYGELVLKGLGSREERNPGKVLARGAKIAKQMIGEMGEQGQMWKVLADFWAELVLFLAPTDQDMAHAQRLAEGGEFITHLWALLVHAGILERQQGQNVTRVEIQMPAVYRRSNTA